MTPLNTGAQRIIELLNDDAALLDAMSHFAKIQLRDLNKYSDQEIEECADESRENEPVYNDYYRFCDQFQRKVLTAATALI